MTKKKVVYDKENDIVTIQWGKLKGDYIGWSEELNLGGVTIIVDRNKKGEVKALEIM